MNRLNEGRRRITINSFSHHELGVHEAQREIVRTMHEDCRACTYANIIVDKDDMRQTVDITSGCKAPSGCHHDREEIYSKALPTDLTEWSSEPEMSAIESSDPIKLTKYIVPKGIKQKMEMEEMKKIERITSDERTSENTKGFGSW